MALNRRASGANTVITAPKRRASGAFVAIQNGYRRVSGAWVAIYTAISASIIDRSILSSGVSGTRVAGYKLTAAGQVQTRNGLAAAAYANVGETWLLAGSGFEVRATLSSGTAPTTGTLNTWQALSSDRFWEQSRAGTPNLQCVLLIEIRDAASGTVLDSANITLEAGYA
jgi:hypothetical protein